MRNIVDLIEKKLSTGDGARVILLEDGSNEQSGEICFQLYGVGYRLTLTKDSAYDQKIEGYVGI